MGKKKDKTFSYNNTHGHGIYPPVPAVGQRYPHTDFHHNDPFWIYEELGILKDWLISLTKLGGMLAQTETNDVSDIINEIKKLVDTLKNLISGLYNSLNALYYSEIEYNNSLVEALGLSDSLATNIDYFINYLSPLFENLFNCIENRLKTDDSNISIIFGDINDINDIINNIWDSIENLSSQSTKAKILTEGEDYSFNFYNGFYRVDYNDSNYLTRKDTQMITPQGIYHSLEYNLTFGGYHRLNNDYVYTTAEDDGKGPIFSHGSDVNGRNYICDLILADGLADFTDSIDSSTFIPSIWNMSPVKARARFPIVNSYHIYNKNTITITMQAIQDGFNQQFFYYIERGDCEELSFGNCALDFTFTTHNFISN